VIQACDGEAAIELLAQVQPALIVSDVRMPGMDGFTLCERVRADPGFAQVPFIFLTARGERADIRRGMGLGADDYLVKPFEPEELLSAVRARLTRVADAQAALAKASTNLQDQIIRSLTHEFRTPLSLVVGYTDLLESTGRGMNEQEFQATLQGLHSGSSRLMGLIEDFLLLSRLRTGATANEIAQVPPLPLPPDAVVRKIVSECHDQAANRSVSLIINCTAPQLTIAISEEHMAEIVRRLMDNAIKFSKSDGGKVLISTRRERNHWVLRITDDGIGIPQEALLWIFEAFQQVDRARMEQQGIGVGLAIVRGLVETHGGYLEVESTLGKGSTFSVRLPRTAR
jgi:signal transduction histidine kinase